ncbi:MULTISPECIES: DNA-directed RNA polymerase subunit omega [Holospora]|uniref:DNA-directed RNA polymerase subunit omega n=2 Tax=Holospora TaxID=44747 RepID=A0A061JHX3_9PROT|nr:MULTISPECIES: DNA-directed RNA polymerase subunit omega [Holospora]ETZ05102.1 DNA-directed RNA polymerase subunit omega [Holospora undulata HU1]GAJ46205.1 DNA-directed RNA polymerase subunit omega [Holospora elegans E1]
MKENNGQEEAFIENRALVSACLENISDPFLLVLLASKRAQELSYGAQAMVSPEGHKDSVIALQEIALKKVSPDVLKETLIEGFRNSRMFSLFLLLNILFFSIC